MLPTPRETASAIERFAPCALRKTYNPQGSFVSTTAMEQTEQPEVVTPDDTPAVAPTKHPTIHTAARKKPFLERAEAYLSRLSTKNNFWHRVCSLIWLPIAFRSGIRMKRVDKKTFTAVLPFRRFNRNWYNAMAGASLLANSEIAGGMYVFGYCGGDYTVVCKELKYKFLRPCFGPAIYTIIPKQDIEELVKDGAEFNIDIVLDVKQQLKKPGVGRERRVGRCYTTFHVTPKIHHKTKRKLRQQMRRDQLLAAKASAQENSDTPNTPA